MLFEADNSKAIKILVALGAQLLFSAILILMRSTTE